MTTYSLLNWNVNGLRARWDQLKQMIQEDFYDIICLQEIKCDEDSADWIIDELHELGYWSYLNSYQNNSGLHGTGIFIKKSLAPVLIFKDTEGRVQSAKFPTFDLINVYINQGQELGSDEYHEKLELMNRLYHHVKSLDRPVIIVGDYNICPTDDDVWSTDHWDENTVSCSPPEREAFNRILNDPDLKLRNLDVVNEIKFTWYGYRHTWRKYSNDQLIEHTGRYGVKCDHVLTNIDGASDIILLDHYRLPKVRSEVTTSDHVAMAMTISLVDS